MAKIIYRPDPGETDIPSLEKLLAAWSESGLAKPTDEVIYDCQEIVDIRNCQVVYHRSA